MVRPKGLIRIKIYAKNGRLTHERLFLMNFPNFTLILSPSKDK